MGDLWAFDWLRSFLGHIIRPIRMRVMTAEGRRMKKRRTATSEKRMLGTEEEEKIVWSSGAQLHDVYDHTSTGLHKKSALGSHHIHTHTHCHTDCKLYT